MSYNWHYPADAVYILLASILFFLVVENVLCRLLSLSLFGVLFPHRQQCHFDRFIFPQTRIVHPNTRIDFIVGISLNICDAFQLGRFAWQLFFLFSFWFFLFLYEHLLLGKVLRVVCFQYKHSVCLCACALSNNLPFRPCVSYFVDFLGRAELCTTIDQNWSG